MGVNLYKVKVLSAVDMKKSMDETVETGKVRLILEKGRKGLADGTIREWHGKKYKKEAGKWNPVGEGRGRGRPKKTEMTSKDIKNKSEDAANKSVGIRGVKKVLGVTGKIDWSTVTKEQAKEALAQSKGMSNALALKLKEIVKNGPREKKAGWQVDGATGKKKMKMTQETIDKRAKEKEAARPAREAHSRELIEHMKTDGYSDKNDIAEAIADFEERYGKPYDENKNKSTDAGESGAEKSDEKNNGKKMEQKDVDSGKKVKG